MKRTALLLALLLGSACSDKGLYDDAVKAFERHGYRDYSAAEVRSALEAKGFPGLAALDPHARLVPGKLPVRQRAGKAPLSAGLLVGYSRGAVYVLKVFRGSPAEAAGLRDGDRLLEIDGQQATPHAVAEKMTDAFGYSLKTAGPRPGAAASEVRLNRQEFYFPLVFGFMEPGTDTAYVKVGMLVQGSSSAVTAGLEALSALGARKLVLDLRDSPGGVAAEAAGLLGAFAPRAGPVLELKSAHPGYAAVFEASGRGRFADLKTAVLTDAGTGKAAEAFAQALRELAGARLVGGRTMGDVSVTRTFRLGRGGKGLELTVARILPPSGLDLEGKGAEPDVPVDVDEKARQDLREAWGSSSETALLGDRAYAAAVEILSK